MAATVKRGHALTAGGSVPRLALEAPELPRPIHVAHQSGRPRLGRASCHDGIAGGTAPEATAGPCPTSQASRCWIRSSIRNIWLKSGRASAAGRSQCPTERPVSATPERALLPRTPPMPRVDWPSPGDPRTGPGLRADVPGPAGHSTAEVTVDACRRAGLLYASVVPDRPGRVGSTSSPGEAATGPVIDRPESGMPQSAAAPWPRFVPGTTGLHLNK
jgi:hypothetical protein